MRIIKLSTLAVLILSLSSACQSSNSKINNTSDEPVIFAVNTGDVGYYTDEQGTLLFGKQFDKVEPFYDDFAAVQSDGKWGFIDTKGQIVIPCVYDELEPFYNGLASVELNSKWGFIDTKSQVVIPFEYDEAKSFNTNFAAVEKNGKWGVINKDGEYVIQPIAENISW